MFSAKLPTLRPAACTALMCAGRYCRIFFEPYRVISVTRPGSFNGSSTLSRPTPEWAAHDRVHIRVHIRVCGVCSALALRTGRVSPQPSLPAAV